MERPVVVVDLKKCRIRIHKNTLRSIGDPDYVLLLVNPEERTLAILHSDRSDPLAHHKPSELYSRSLIKSLRDICSNWEDNQSYRLYGKVIPNEGLVLFRMDESVLSN